MCEGVRKREPLLWCKQTATCAKHAGKEFGFIAAVGRADELQLPCVPLHISLCFLSNGFSSVLPLCDDTEVEIRISADKKRLCLAVSDFERHVKF